MSFDRYVGLATAIGLILIWAIVAWLGVAGPVWRASWTATPAEWLGFAGNVFGGLITLAAAAVAWFAVQAQIKEQRIATEKQRRDAVELRLTDYGALIFVLRNEYSRIFNGSDVGREALYSEFERFRTSPEFLPLISDPILGKDHKAIAFFANILRNDAAIRLGKLKSEHAKNYEFVIEMLSEHLHDMIVQRRNVMRKGSVDDLIDLKLVKVGPYRKALVNGGPIIDLGDDDYFD